MVCFILSLILRIAMLAKFIIDSVMEGTSLSIELSGEGGLGSH
jgi:hypothetical protein